MAQDYELLRIKVRIGDKEAEVSYPITPRTTVDYNNKQSTILSAVTAVRDIVEILTQES